MATFHRMKHFLCLLLITGCATTSEPEKPPTILDFGQRRLLDLAPRAGDSPKTQLISAIARLKGPLLACGSPDRPDASVDILLSVAFDPTAHIDGVVVSGADPLASCVRSVLESADVSQMTAPDGANWRMYLPLVVGGVYTETP